MEEKQYWQLVQTALRAASEQYIGIHFQPTGVHLNLPLRYLTSHVPYNGYIMILEDQKLSTVPKTSIILPKSKCKYYLTGYKTGHGPYVTFENSGYENFSMEFSYKDHNVTLLPTTHIISIDGVQEEDDHFRKSIIYRELFAELKYGILLVTTRNLIWEFRLNEIMNIMHSFSLRDVSGIGWIQFEKSITEDQKLLMFEPYKVNPLCVP